MWLLQEERLQGQVRNPCGTFVDCIERAGYQGRIWIECKWDGFLKKASVAREYLKVAF